jgi:hypothetical protein
MTTDRTHLLNPLELLREREEELLKELEQTLAALEHQRTHIANAEVYVEKVKAMIADTRAVIEKLEQL